MNKANIGLLWITGLTGLLLVAIVALYYFPIEPAILKNIALYPVSVEPPIEPTTINNSTIISSDWITNKNKGLILLYPHITECGLGVVQYNNKTYVTAIIRKSEVSQWDRRYIEGINYYFKYLPKGTDNNNIDWSIFKINEDTEKGLLDNINNQRNANNYNSISSNKELTDKARTHSASMALQSQAFTYGVNSPYYMALWCEK